MDYSRRRDIVLQLLEEADPRSAAQKFAVDTERDWANKVAAGAVTSSDESPSLGDIVSRSSARSFPALELGSGWSAACFFASSYFGRQDVIHVQLAGAADISIVDIDENRTAHIQRTYPSVGRAIIGDAFGAARVLGEQGEMFDLVVCDPPSGDLMLRTLSELSFFWKLSRRVCVVGSNQDTLKKLGAEYTSEDVAEYFSKALDGVGTCSMLKRNTAGVCWITIGRALE